MFGSPDFVSYSHGHRCTYDEFWLDDVICAGTETKLAECAHEPWGESDCNPDNNCLKLYCVGEGA